MTQTPTAVHTLLLMRSADQTAPAAGELTSALTRTNAQNLELEPNVTLGHPQTLIWNVTQLGVIPAEVANALAAGP